jgi:hypothetical protein
VAGALLNLNANHGTVFSYSEKMMYIVFYVCFRLKFTLHIIIMNSNSLVVINFLENL